MAASSVPFTVEDPYLAPFTSQLTERYNRYVNKKNEIIAAHGSLTAFAEGYKYYGFNKSEGGWVYREWAPGAQALSLMGEFNGWNRSSHTGSRNEYGVWEVVLPNKDDGSPLISHNSLVKACLTLADGTQVDRIPAWITRAVQHNGEPYIGVFMNPPCPYVFKHKAPPMPQRLRIYESHVGIASPSPHISTYRYFTEHLLDYIVSGGYNAIQLMAIMEHAYYASFGYQVNSFFAVSSRFGSPDELKELIDTAHSKGLVVFLDLVHSHASKNVLDGLNLFDGTDHHYFHGGERGTHAQWDSRLFNYGHWEVLRFLLSNVHWYMSEYGFDGFRYDGVTSMLYKHHGIAKSFSGSYAEYFGDDVDDDALVYLMLANDLIHTTKSDAVSIAEDVSGMVMLCRSLNEGGVGFDYRLAMAIPDKWIELLKTKGDDEWNMGNIVFTLQNRASKEKAIVYCESHDQALVGDKTIAFWLMDSQMYTNMSKFSPRTIEIDRGLALHKMIRLVTYGLGGEGWLCFMGNEFGHPEWLDFPREGNHDSFTYCRRQYNLVSDDLLRYGWLRNFDVGMHSLESRACWLSSRGYVTTAHEDNKVISFYTGGRFVFVFNFHPSVSYTDYSIGTPWPGTYGIALDSDWEEFGGFGRNDRNQHIYTETRHCCGENDSFKVYIPSRTALVLERLNDVPQAVLEQRRSDLHWTKFVDVTRDDATVPAGAFQSLLADYRALLASNSHR